MKKNTISFILLNLLLQLNIIGQVPDRGVGNKPTTTFAEKRLALVIGNSKYTNTSPLTNPANDATDMTKALESLGFEVLSGTNQTKRQMETLIRQFGDKLARQGGVGLFFYAGHGLQVRGQNYLVPVEAEIPSEDEVEYAAVNLSFLLSKMDVAGNNLNIVILDACRNNPFAQSWRNFRDVGDGKGLAKVTPPTGTIMLYATQPGNVASDGDRRNGLFTESLLEQIKKPNLEFDAMVKLLARDVYQKSYKKQLPWKEGIVLGDFYFAVNGNSSPNTTSNNQSTYTPPTNPPTSNSSGRRSFTFTTPRTDAKGNIVQQISGSAYYEVEDLGNSVTLEMVEINGYSGGKFWAGKYEVTQAQWKAIMGYEDLTKRKCFRGTFTANFIGENKPMICVSWDEFQEFIKKLNQKTGKKYRLPKEVEWEYAARGGTTTKFAFGENITTDLANYDGSYPNGNSPKERYIGHITEVGSYPANLYGLYDIHGNVWEWCEDRSDATIPVRVARGASWNLYGFFLIDARDNFAQNTKLDYLGFRLVRD